MLEDEVGNDSSLATTVTAQSLNNSGFLAVYAGSADGVFGGSNGQTGSTTVDILSGAAPALVACATAAAMRTSSALSFARNWAAYAASSESIVVGLAQHAPTAVMDSGLAGQGPRPARPVVVMAPTRG